MRQVLRTRVASSAMRVEKLCAGVPSFGDVRVRPCPVRPRSAWPVRPDRAWPWPSAPHRRTSARARPRACATRRSRRACTGRCARAPGRRSVVDRTHLQVDGLERAERPLDVGQRLVVAHARRARPSAFAATGADDVDAVERGLGGDLSVRSDLILEGGVADAQLEVLGDLVLVEHLARPARRSQLPARAAPRAHGPGSSRGGAWWPPRAPGACARAAWRAADCGTPPAARRDSPGCRARSRLRSSNRPSCSAPASTQAADRAALQRGDPASPSMSLQLADRLVRDHAAITDHHHALDAEGSRAACSPGASRCWCRPCCPRAPTPPPGSLAHRSAVHS